MILCDCHIGSCMNLIFWVSECSLSHFEADILLECMWSNINWDKKTFCYI